ncbi:hypothetical protein Glove_165g80 [Diversispora epigaea]|uniref:Uncharacterized protein n=1 Tax=Diversispora epigaea TaxID=1348612 RepID=A0A397IQR2_9GLOM|nr:hypothetical protein Glove_165g80 [Diversispora epigaea]
MNSRLLYHKHSILSYNNVKYFIHYCSIVNCIENLLSNLEIIKHFAYDYKDLTFEEEKSYGEQFTRNWWKSVNVLIPSAAKVLSIILYSDATTLDTLEKSLLHLIYISLRNILTWRGNKEDAKQLLNYLLIISAKDETEKKSSEFKILVRKTFHNSIKFLLEPLFENASIDLKITGKRIWFYSRITTVICDWPEALSKDNLANTCLKKNQAFEEEKSYGEQFTRNWWKSVNVLIPSAAKVLSIILYSDATTLDTLEKSLLHLIYISLRNILTWRGNKEDAKQLLNYLLIISAKDETEKKSSEFKILVRKTFHNSIKFLLEPLFENASIDLKITGKRIWFYSRITTVICDWPEALSKDNLANTCLKKNQAVPCNKENMKKYYDNNTTKEASLEPVYNYFWDIPDLNIYDTTVPDRMHLLDLDLYYYQIEFTKELLSKSSINKFNRRIAEIPRHPGLKIFAGGLQSIVRLTINEFRDLMKVIEFVVDDLHNKDLLEVYVKWNEMYLLSRLETFKESDLKIFQKAIDDWANLFIKLFQNISELKFPKLHS